MWREVVSSISLILIFFDLWRGLKNCLVYCCYCMVICWDSMWYIAVGSYKEAIWKQGNLQSIITLVTSLEIDETINTGPGKLICVCSILLNNVNSVWFSMAGSISHMVFGVLLQWSLAVRMSAGALPASPSCARGSAGGHGRWHAPWTGCTTLSGHPWVAGAEPELERTGEAFLGEHPTSCPSIRMPRPGVLNETGANCHWGRIPLGMSVLAALPSTLLVPQLWAGCGEQLTGCERSSALSFRWQARCQKCTEFLKALEWWIMALKKGVLSELCSR